MQDIVGEDEGLSGGNGSLTQTDFDKISVVAGISELLKAYQYARDAGRTVWDLAVEISLLRELGLTSSDLRWLLCKGYIEHARDITREEDKAREFRSCTQLLFAKRSCFVLTDAGAAYADSLLSKELQVLLLRRKDFEQSDESRNGKLMLPASVNKPRWDGERHELWVGDQLVKQFKGQALNQETILAVFEEEGWPPRTDDPLPLAEEIDPKRRLSDTIKCLNRKQRHQLIHFRGDGTGEGIIWELIEPNGSHGHHN